MTNSIFGGNFVMIKGVIPANINRTPPAIMGPISRCGVRIWNRWMQPFAHSEVKFQKLLAQSISLMGLKKSYILSLVIKQIHIVPC